MGDLVSYLKANKFQDSVGVPEMPWKSSKIEIVVDFGDEGYSQIGDWVESTYSTGYQGTNYFHDAGTTENGWSVTFKPNLEIAGDYEVFTYHIAGGNRATNVPVDINHSQGKTTVVVNQQENDKVWLSLGEYYFNAGNTGSVVLRNDDADNVVIADAMKFVCVNPEPPLKPQAAFSANVTEIDEGAEVSFTDESLNDPTSWLWTFEGGTPSSSTEQNPTVSYQTAGTYDIKLVASNAGGKDSLLIAGYIVVNQLVFAPVANFEADNTHINIGASVKFTDLSENAPTEWLWSFEGGDPAESTLQHPLVVYATAGVFAVKLKVINQEGSDELQMDDYIVVDDTVGVYFDKGAEDIRIFPNPAESYIEISSILRNKSLAVFVNSKGKKVYETFVHAGQNRINISDFNPGMYILIVGNRNYRFVKLDEK